MGTVGIGMLGCGIVGSAVVRMIDAHSRDIASRTGAVLEIRKVAVRDVSRNRDVPLKQSVFTNDPAQVVNDPSVQIVVEVMGGLDPAKDLILAAMKSGKHVVSANKELISTQGKKLFETADESHVDFYFEGSVAGGIPIIKPLKESLAGDRIKRVLGIVNGTTNYVLTRMTEEGVEFEEALVEADRRGFAELDPTDDIEGFDAASKLAILASVAFNCRVVAGDVYREGISSVSARDIRYAKQLGYTVKLLAVAENSNGEVGVRVHPAMIPSTHPLASVRENLNAVFVEGEEVGELMFYGRGAGGPPTATSVVGDVVDVARNIANGTLGVGCTCYRDDAVIRHMDETLCQYYLLIEVIDRPGVLAQVAEVFAANEISIKSMWQEGMENDASLVMVTHQGRERNYRKLLEELAGLEVVREVASAMRVQSDEA